MKVIKVKHPHAYKQSDFPPLSVALGFFDGVHKGHQEVIASAIRTAREKGFKSAAMTFDPHPKAVLQSDSDIQYITPLEDKILLMDALGLDYLFVVEFDRSFASLSPEAFVEQYLLQLNVRHVTAGFDYSYGKYGEGKMDTLPIYSKGRLEQTIIEKQELDHEKISSTRIRLMLREGLIERFFELAGRHYRTEGIVVHGEKRGRTLGFPTANIKLKGCYIIPATGVYAVKVYLDGQVKTGVCNVGYKPTFHDNRPSEPSIEVHILDYKEDIYGQTISIEWHKRLRGEKKFGGIKELVAQINQDKQATMELFKETIK
ncbi:MAG: bifunctional riboflavin kinase/FAD synthetase [Bacillus sp. (in: firmicutes)]